MVLIGGEGGAFDALGVSADGSIVVGYGPDPESSFFGAFRWTSAGGIEWLGFLPGEIDSSAHAISDDGSTIVGRSGLGPFRWTRAEGMVELERFPDLFEASPLDVSSDGSVAVGWTETFRAGSPLMTAAMWPSATEIVTLGFLPGFENESGAYAISADGSTIVGYSRGDEGSQVFRWTSEAGMVGLDLLPGATSGVAFDVSADGTTIVGATDLGPFVWDPTNGMRLLGQVLTELGVDLGGWQLALDGGVLGVSADGKTIVGTARNPEGVREAWIAVIPEPGTALLLAVGLFGLGARRIRNLGTSIEQRRSPSR
jgi:uncharacterized membrane protein